MKRNNGGNGVMVVTRYKVYFVEGGKLTIFINFVDFRCYAWFVGDGGLYQNFVMFEIIKVVVVFTVLAILTIFTTYATYMIYTTYTTQFFKWHE